MTDPYGGRYEPLHGDPVYGEPQYPPSPYAQPPYEQPPYGQPPHGQAPYGQAPYGQPQYAQPPASGGVGRRWRYGGVAVVVAAGLGVGGYLVARPGSGGAEGSPRATAVAILDAGRRGDVAAIRSHLCSADLADPDITVSITSSSRIKSYTIDGVTQLSSTRAEVTATVRSADGSPPDTSSLPMVKEGGAWKVCFPTQGFTSPGGTSAPNVPAPAPTTTGECRQLASSGPAVAAFYAYAAGYGQSSLAQSCVYGNFVTLSVTQSLSGKSLRLDLGASDPAGGTLAFTAGSSEVRVSVTQEPDGRFYVTKVVVS